MKVKDLKAKKIQKKKVIQSSGKRKRSIARATLKEGIGKIRINKILLKNYQPLIAQQRVMEPLILAGDIVNKININVKVNGGGWHSQADASRLAIAKALAEYDKRLRKVFLEYDRHLLVVDVRYKETRKPNDSKTRKSRQFYKR